LCTLGTERLGRLGTMPSRARNLAEYSSWETDGGGDYRPSPTVVRLDASYLMTSWRLRQTVLLIGGSSLTRQTHIVITSKKNKKHSRCGRVRVTAPWRNSIANAVSSAKHREHKLCHGAMYSFKTGYILQTMREIYPRRAS
jgi:hypothetical protein